MNKWILKVENNEIEFNAPNVKKALTYTARYLRLYPDCSTANNFWKLKFNSFSLIPLSDTVSYCNCKIIKTSKGFDIIFNNNKTMNASKKTFNDAIKYIHSTLHLDYTQYAEELPDTKDEMLKQITSTLKLDQNSENKLFFILKRYGFPLSELAPLDGKALQKYLSKKLLENKGFCFYYAEKYNKGLIYYPKHVDIFLGIDSQTRNKLITEGKLIVIGKKYYHQYFPVFYKYQVEKINAKKYLDELSEKEEKKRKEQIAIQEERNRIFLEQKKAQKEFKKAVNIETKKYEKYCFSDKKRKFVIHVGEANSGKTHAAVENLKNANNGIYLCPLRLLSIEIFENLNEYKTDCCSLLTGEEAIFHKDSPFFSMTVEKAPFNKNFDVAVIDECQMLSSDRSAAWTKAILCLKASEIHLITASEGLEIIKKMLEQTGEKYEIVAHHRMTELVCEESELEEIKEGDALITFSRASVLALADSLEQAGYKCSVLYGNLPYSAKKEESRKFKDKETNILVSTDAIGMGLNLPIKRIVFMQDKKFNGYNVNYLTPSEVKQIAGRAGRFGIYNTGYVTAKDKYTQYTIENGMNQETKAITSFSMPFPEVLLDLNYDFYEIIDEWKRVNTHAFINHSFNVDYNVKRCLRNYKLTNLQYYLFHTIGFDSKNDILLSYFEKLVNCYLSGGSIKDSYPENNDESLESLENTYKQLDLYYLFCKKFQLEIDENKLYQDRDNISFKIIALLKVKKSKFSRKCRICGKELSWDHKGTMCNSCYENSHTSYSYYDGDYFFY